MVTNDELTGEFLGELEPVYGRWVWPFRRMKVGDWFKVRFDVRLPGDVRQLAGVRAAQLGIKIGVTTELPEHPDFTVVVRRPDDWENPGRYSKELDYQALGTFLRSVYEVEPDSIPWHAFVREGETRGFTVQKVRGDPRKEVIARVGNQRFKLELLPSLIRATLLKGAESREGLSFDDEMANLLS
jgi:hypothetical protein